MINNFIVNKIDDTVAPRCEEKLLLDLGLIYGDILAFKETFSTSSTSSNQPKAMFYRERARQLQVNLKRTHTERLNSSKKPITVKTHFGVTFGLKCLEDNKYVHKSNKNTVIQIERDATYEEIHDTCRKHFKVAKSIKTYLATYSGKHIKDSFTRISEYYLSYHKEKKKSMNFYLYAPVTYGRLGLKW